MGLDIVVYEKVNRSEVQDYGEDKIFIDNNFHHNPDIKEGWYEISGNSDSFRAGPYSYYNQFRDALCYAIHGVSAQEFWMNSNSYLGSEFYELIDFSDCEGVLGPRACQKLSNDFNTTNRWKFIHYLKEGESVAGLDEENTLSALEKVAGLSYDEQKDDKEFITLYDDFMTAFSDASGGGAIRFC